MPQDYSKRKSQVESEGINPVPETPYSASRLVIHQHKAHKAGDHFDIRVDLGNKAVSFATRKGLPKAGEPVYLIRQPDHVVSYMDWEGDIPKGEYGAGKVVKTFESPVVMKSHNDAIHLTIPDGENKGTYVFLRKDDEQWLGVKKKDLPRAWEERPKYRETLPDKVDDKDYFATEKIDGAHFLAALTPRGISFTSQRKSAQGELIERENNVPHLRDLKAPKKYDGFVLRGELWHDKGFNTVSGILNSKPPRAVETQKKVGLIQFAPFRIHKGPNGEENLPYEEQFKIIKEISKEFPHYFEPPRVSDKPHKDFFDEIGREKGEGIVLVNKQTGENYKMKHRYDYDLIVDSFTPGTGKYEGRAVGAINLKDKNGRMVGKVGTGLTDEMRIDMYKNPNKYVGKLVKVESRKPLIGQLREPSFLGLTTDKNDPDEVV